MRNYSKEREIMVKTQLMSRDITDKGVLKAMREIPRELFVPEGFRHNAFDDNPLPIGESQTISQPYMAALMTQELKLTGKEKVLEIGSGSGYQTAILAYLAKEVYTVELIPELTKRAKEQLKDLKIKNVNFKTGDGTLGWEECAPFDRIIVTAGAPEIPEPYIKQLNNNGILIIPVGDSTMQVLKIVRKVNDKITIEDSTGCIFVKLIGKYGWKAGK